MQNEAPTFSLLLAELLRQLKRAHTDSETKRALGTKAYAEVQQRQFCQRAGAHFSQHRCLCLQTDFYTSTCEGYKPVLDQKPHIYGRKTLTANKRDTTDLRCPKMLHIRVWNMRLLLFWTGPYILQDLGSFLTFPISFIITDRKRRTFFFYPAVRPAFHFEMNCCSWKRKHYLCTCKRSYSSKRLFYHFSAHSR